MKPTPGNIYIMRPNFVKSTSRTKRLTRPVKVIDIEILGVPAQRVEFVRIEELTLGPESRLNPPGLLWTPGSRTLKELRIYNFIPLSEEHLTHKCPIIREATKQKLQGKKEKTMGLAFYPKTETKAILAKGTTPISNHIIGYKSKEKSQEEVLRLQTLYGDLLAWFLKHGLTAGGPQKKHIEKMSSLLGVPPSYYTVLGSDRFRNAIWSLGWKRNKALLFLSIKGFHLEIEENFDPNLIEEFLNYLSTLILKD